MLKFTVKDKRTNLEKEIDELLKIMATYDPSSKEYSHMSENLERLYKAKAQDRIRHISPDTVLVVAGNLLGIGIILCYEQANIITSKALGFVLKGRA